MAALIYMYLARGRASSPLLDMILTAPDGHPIGDAFFAFVHYNEDLVMVQRCSRHMVRSVGLFFIGDPTWRRIPHDLEDCDNEDEFVLH